MQRTDGRMAPMKKDRRAILFRVGGLGDLLVALPAIALGRRALPGHHLTLVGRPEYSALLVRAGIVDEAMAFEDPKVTAIFAGNGGLLGEFELAMGWWNRRGDWLADEWWARQGIGRTGFVTYDGSSGRPISRYFFDRTQEFFGTEDLFADCARLALPAVLIKKALDDLGLLEPKANERRLVVHPGSGGRAKRWPLPNFMEVVRRAASRGVNGVLVTGEAEEDLEPALKALALPAAWARVSRLPAETLAGLLASSTHYIGNDSGPTHLAAACGTRVLAFFREENMPAWQPFGRSHVLCAPAVDRIPLASALPAIDDFLAS